MTQTALDALCRDLVAEFKRDPRGTAAAQLLATYAREHRDWRDYVFFSGERYTRNLVHRDKAYELLLLCWEEGQESPIHNHDQQSCWMAVLDGELEEVHFHEADSGSGPLREGRVQPLGAGQVAFIEDDIALHLIRPRAGRGVSLHLYASPIDACKTYGRDGQVTCVEMGYHSVRGELCEKSPATIRSEFEASCGS